MNRRQFLSLMGGSAGWFLLSAHSPYRQWIVYRETHLMIMTSRDDPAGDVLGEELAAITREALPDSKAVVARGPRVQRIASLISTRQAEVGVVSRANALAMFHGEGAFRDYGAIALRVLVQTDRHQLVCRDDFLPEHGFLMAEALLQNGSGLGLSIPRRDTVGAGEIPAHVGALAFAEGRSPDPGDPK